MLPFFSKLKRFFNWFRPSKIAYSVLNDTRFQKEVQQWLSRLKPEEKIPGYQILQSIATAIGSHPKQIDLSKFKVSKFPEKLIIQWLPDLESADFSNQNIQSIAFINKLKKLKRLKLNHCKIKKINNINLPNLEHLSLSWNQLSGFKKCDLKKVTDLNINNNKIKELETLLTIFPNIERLYLANNEIDKKSLAVIKTLEPKNIKFIDLRYNSICDELTENQPLTVNKPYAIRFFNDNHYNARFFKYPDQMLQSIASYDPTGHAPSSRAVQLLFLLDTLCRPVTRSSQGF